MAVILLSGGFPGTHPLSLSPYHYYDFTDITKLWQDTGRTSQVTTNGQSIKGVTDQGSGLNHLSEATNAPTYNTGPSPTFNGWAVGDFDNTNDILTGGTSYQRFGGSRSAYWTVMAVYLCKASAAEGAGYNPGKSLWWHGAYKVASSTTTVNPNYQAHDNNSGTGAIARKACTINTVVSGTHIGHGDGQADPNFTVTTKAGVTDTRDASLASATSAIGSFTDVSTAPIMGLRTVTWNGYVAELAQWNSLLSESDRQSVERYWAWKYNLTLPY